MRSPLSLLIAVAACAALLATSCRRDRSSVDATAVDVVPLYSLVSDYPAASDSLREAVLEMPEMKAFMSTITYKPLTDSLVEAWAESRPVTVFTPAVDSVFADTDYVARSLGRILARADAQGLELPRRRYATVVYGRRESMLFVDSVLLVALNHYLGADYPGYAGMPEFLRRVKTPEALPYDLAEALVATAYPYEADGSDATLLSRMLYEGALIHARRVLTGGTAEGALGYDKEQLKWLDDNEDAIRESLVVDRLLYDTSETLIDRMMAPSPAVRVVRPEAPGRVGRYLGYRMIERYLAKHPDTSIATLLSPDFYTSSQAL
ncbi:MAG: DUF2268 domain-containing protein [Muribaculaceae bacterium]|nr:DUF2268 domain-containing protein [Muribaculaceae bacterium]